MQTETAKEKPAVWKIPFLETLKVDQTINYVYNSQEKGQVTSPAQAQYQPRCRFTMKY